MATVNYSWTLPTVGASVNTWGTLLNTIIDDIDAKMVSKTGTQTLTNKTLTAPVINGFTGDTSAINIGSGQLVKDTSGNVGFGVTPSGWGGSKALEINGAGSSVWSQGAGDMRLSSGMYFNGTNAIYSATGNAVSQYRAYLGQHIWYTAPSGTAGNAITFTQAMTLDASGLAVVGSVSATGINFPTTQNPSPDPNTLDDYEEGTWTPVVGGTATYTVQEGQYTKIGRTVYVKGKIQINAIGTGSQTTISGLPFTADAPSSGSYGTGAVGYFSGLASSVYSITCYVGTGSSTIAFNTLTAAATTPNNAAVVMISGTRIDFSFTYTTST